MYRYPLRLFGPGLLVDASGHPVPMRSRKQLGLLAYLATEHQFAHSRETLLALFWPDESTLAAQNNLRVTFSRLRDLAGKLVAMDAPSNDLLITDRNKVQLHPTWIERVDVNHFFRLLHDTRQHKHASRSQCAACQADLRTVVQLYQGGFLTGFRLNDCPAFEEWLLIQRERLHLLAVEAYSDLAIYAEVNGDLVAARDFAQHEIELDPLREPAYRQQMRILAKLGERSAALAAFERCRAVLSEELGLDPEPETLALHLQILNATIGTETIIANDVTRLAPVATGAGVALTTNLPQQLTPFIGREEELAQLHARLANPAYRLLSIVGPGGVGKSRLAHQVAALQSNRFADGVYFVALAQVPTAESIPVVLADTMGLAFAASPKPPAEQLFTMLGGKQLLLVLDNFEHLMDGVDFLVNLLRQAPQVVLIVTSRERLNLQAEDLFELQGLPTPTSGNRFDLQRDSHFAAIRLFVDRAHRLDKQFKLSAEQLPHVVRICQLVEGFPLAIELAATWLRDRTCAEIVVELTAGLDRLETTLRDMDPQHRSLRTIFDASWRLLDASEQRALARLAFFRGGFTLEAARSIADASPLVLGALRNKSLLRAAGSRRYDMHALVHQFAAEALATDTQEMLRVQRAHCHYFMTLLAEQALALDSRNARIASDKIQPDWENVVLAWQQATERVECELLYNALDGLVRFCNLRGLFQEAQLLLESTVGHFETLLAGAQDDLERLNLFCRLQTALAYFTGRCCQHERTFERSQRALALAVRLKNHNEIINNQLIQASACELVGDYPQGIHLAESALALAQAAGLEVQAGRCLDILGTIAMVSGKFEQANQLFKRVLAIHTKTERLEQRGRAAIGYLGLVAAEQGRYDVALDYGRAYLASCEAMADRRNTALAQHYLARLWLLLGDFAQAIVLEEQSAAQLSAIGDREMSSFALHSQACAHRHAGQLPEALACATQSVALARTLDAPLALAFALGQLAEVQMVLATTAEDWGIAAANFQTAATSLRAIGKLTVAYEAEIGLAELARRCGDMEAALKQIMPILPHLPTTTADGWDEPIRAYVVCLEILYAAHQPVAEQILNQGIHLLNCLAQNITDPKLRQHFLRAVPAHRQLQAFSRSLGIGQTNLY